MGDGQQPRREITRVHALFFVSFADEKGREKYLPHAAHQDFVSIVKDHVDDVCVVDYWTGK